MAYATVAELVSLFGQRETALLSTHGDSDEVDAAALETAIRYACSEVDSYLSGRYAVPLAEPVPPVVMMAVGDIVRYRLTGGDLTEKDPILARYKATVAWLRDVASGVVSLPCAGAAPEATPGGVGIDCGRKDWRGGAWQA